ncbi:hypothetical protein NBZ79_07785 [Sneathiella marina]|uniref:Uncharacterized protein n=1 Tax=Sneathiella marina TaxID=2950108 RepID=A0ABY4WAT9_9PROT|nr:hypothetical protein [Sneathiella marina]USG62875.1 hypothetical protein NBZ79_07785 [Sneathiella marina]
MKDRSPRLLKTSLLINAAFSLTSGLACLVFADILSPWTAIPSWILYSLGVGLLLFAADVALTATRTPINPLFAKIIIGADIAWVMASVGVLIFFGSLLTLPGQLLIELVAIAVAVLATVQAVGLRQMRDVAQLTV